MIDGHSLGTDVLGTNNDKASKGTPGSVIQLDCASFFAVMTKMSLT
jgi:hypothetical protein